MKILLSDKAVKVHPTRPKGMVLLEFSVGDLTTKEYVELFKLVDKARQEPYRLGRGVPR